MSFIGNLYTIEITATDANYAQTIIYTGIEAKIQTASRSIDLSGDLSANSDEFYKYVLINAANTNVKAGQIVTYTDAFSNVIKLKIINTDMIEFISKDNFIELLCKHVS